MGLSAEVIIILILIGVMFVFPLIFKIIEFVLFGEESHGESHGGNKVWRKVKRAYGIQ